jgi:hypothetical protein
MEKHLIRNYDVSETAEAIASAAILVMGRIFTGPSHMQAVLNFFRDPTVTQAEKDSVLTKTGDEEIDGFLTTTGRFVGREEGYKIALASKQLKAGWNDPKFAADFTSSADPKLDSGWLESYAVPKPEALRGLYEALECTTPAEQRLIESTIKALQSLSACQHH